MEDNSLHQKYTTRQTMGHIFFFGGGGGGGELHGAESAKSDSYSVEI